MENPPEASGAPVCTYCDRPAQLVTGEVIYPHRSDLAHKYFWQCAPCDAHVGTHAGTQRPLGTPAKKDLRRAREILHEEMIDPLWKNAPYCGAYTFVPGDERAVKKIQRGARERVYRFLAHRLGLSRGATHTGMFTIERCRAAWVALRNVTYLEIREWDKRQQEASGVEPRRSVADQALPPPIRGPGPARNAPCPCGSGHKYKKCCAPHAVTKRP